jgi:hypothetical protein
MMAEKKQRGDRGVKELGKDMRRKGLGRKRGRVRQRILRQGRGLGFEDDPRKKRFNEAGKKKRK